MATEQQQLESKWQEKQLYVYFKRQTNEIAHEKTCTSSKRIFLRKKFDLF